MVEKIKILQHFSDGRNGLEPGNAMLLSGLKDKTVYLPLDEKEYAAELEKLIAASRYHKKAVAAAAGNDFSKSFNQ